MTSKRVYKKPISIVHTLSEMEQMTDTQLDEDLFRAFRSIISYYPTGTTVLLSNHSITIVEKNQLHSLDRPMVRIIFDLQEQKEVFHRVDLNKNKNIKIEREIITEEYIHNPSILEAVRS